MAPPRLVVAALASGQGKTLLTSGLVRLFQRRRLAVQPFKAGPDYVDPTFLSHAAGRTARNLDTVLLAPEVLRQVFLRGAADADLALIEGVMGLFDGRGQEAAGSTLSLVRMLGAPVVLVIDAKGMAQSAAALVLGCLAMEPSLPLAGVILNRVGSDRHARLLREAIEERAGVPVFGYLPASPTLALPERHLGLVPAGELLERAEAAIAEAERLLGENLDAERLLAAAAQAPTLPKAPVVAWPRPTERVLIAVAEEPAFSFYYPENREILEDLGARLVPVAPSRDASLPEVDGLYLGGGFPELYRESLSANRSFRESVAAAVRGGMPVFAECGGMMYLTGAIRDVAGERCEMVGVLEGETRMSGRRVRIGYVEGTAESDSLLFRRGETVRGHAFHWSRVVGHGGPFAFRPAGAEEGEGFATPRLLASYLHLHFASEPRWAERFVAAAAAYRKERQHGAAD